MTRNAAHAWANMTTATNIPAVGPAPGWTADEARTAARLLEDEVQTIALSRSVSHQWGAARVVRDAFWPKWGGMRFVGGRPFVEWDGELYDDETRLRAAVANAIEGVKR